VGKLNRSNLSSTEEEVVPLSEVS